jgi:hypothetical protein
VTAYDLHRTFHASEMKRVSDSKQTLLTMWIEGCMRMVSILRPVGHELTNRKVWPVS